MDKKKSRLITIALACLLSVSFASCGSDKDDKKGTTVVTSTTEASKTAEKDDDSKSDDKDDKDTEVTTVTLPEKDDDGSKITVIAVTDENNKAVTDDKGAEVTKVAIVDDKGEVVTDAKGSEVAPNIAVTEATTTTKSDRIVTTAVTSAPDNSGNAETTKNPNAAPVLPDGPVLTIPDNIEAAPGEEFTFKISVTGNAGYSSLIAWLDVNEKYFEYVSFEGGDPDSSNHKRSVERMNTSLTEYKKPGTTDLNTLVLMYFDPQAKNLTGDTTFATVTLKAKDDVKPGEYELCFDTEADGNAMSNRVVNLDPVVLTPTYVNGTVTIK